MVRFLTVLVMTGLALTMSCQTRSVPIEKTEPSTPVAEPEPVAAPAVPDGAAPISDGPKVELEGDARMYAVESLPPMAQGQKFRLHLTPKHDGYLYLVCETRSALRYQMYPAPGATRSVASGTPAVTPEEGWFRMPSVSAEHPISVVVSAKPLTTEAQLLHIERDLSNEGSRPKTRGLMISRDAWIDKIELKFDAGK